MPSPAVRQVDPAIAEAALAAFADEPAKPAVAPSAPVSGRVKSGGVSLQSAKSASHSLRSECTSCGKPFSVNLPPSTNSVVVACPSCGSEQFVELKSAVIARERDGFIWV